MNKDISNSISISEHFGTQNAIQIQDALNDSDVPSLQSLTNLSTYEAEALIKNYHANGGHISSIDLKLSSSPKVSTAKNRVSAPHQKDNFTDLLIIITDITKLLLGLFNSGFHEHVNLSRLSIKSIIQTSMWISFILSVFCILGSSFVELGAFKSNSTGYFDNFFTNIFSHIPVFIINTAFFSAVFLAFHQLKQPERNQQRDILSYVCIGYLFLVIVFSLITELLVTPDILWSPFVKYFHHDSMNGIPHAIFSLLLTAPLMYSLVKSTKSLIKEKDGKL